MNVGKEVAALRRMMVRELRIRYGEVFGEVTRAGNKACAPRRSRPDQDTESPLRARVAVTCALYGNSLERTGLTGRCALAKLPQSYLAHAGAIKYPSKRVDCAVDRACLKK